MFFDKFRHALLSIMVFTYNNGRTDVPQTGRRILMQQEYIEKISPLLEKCDLPTLDLIYQILIKKSQNA